TEAQLEWRHMFNKVVALWHALSPERKGRVGVSRQTQAHDRLRLVSQPGSKT
ncbi:unnamed protein product, partial [marine sediment metagenome]